MDEYKVDTMEYKGYNIDVYVDDDPPDPREWDNLGIMVCFHKRYNLGDETDLTSDMFGSWEELERYLERQAVIIYPLYMYDHSGLRIKIGSFDGLLPQGHAEFDSGQIGYIYTTKDKIRKKFGVKRVTKSLIKRAESILKREVTDYDAYVAGFVYGYMVKDKNDMVIDSCWGFYNDSCEDEAKAAVDAYIEKKISNV